jgi:hypothetical protein
MQKIYLLWINNGQLWDENDIYLLGVYTAHQTAHKIGRAHVAERNAAQKQYGWSRREHSYHVESATLNTELITFSQ